MNLDALTEAVWQRITAEKPRALLLGEAPIDYHKYNYVNTKPYEAVFLGVLPPGELLHMPNDPVCRALLEGIPVFLWHDQLHHNAPRSLPLCRELQKAEQYLLRLGVQRIGEKSRLITADMARAIRSTGGSLPQGSRLTPLAKDILEGKET